MPRCFSISIQSEVAWRLALRALTLPAMWIAPAKSSSFSVSVVLPASGCEMMANVRRRATSWATDMDSCGWPAPRKAGSPGLTFGDAAKRADIYRNRGKNATPMDPKNKWLVPGRRASSGARGMVLALRCGAKQESLDGYGLERSLRLGIRAAFQRRRHRHHDRPRGRARVHAAFRVVGLVGSREDPAAHRASRRAPRARHELDRVRVQPARALRRLDRR